MHDVINTADAIIKKKLNFFIILKLNIFIGLDLRSAGFKCAFLSIYNKDILL